MKKLIPILIGLVVVGCTMNQSTNTNEGNNTPKQKVVGEYEGKLNDGTTHKFILLDNGVKVNYTNSTKRNESKWSVVKGEIHVFNSTNNPGWTFVFKINKDKSLTRISAITPDGKRTDYKNQGTYKKIK